RNTLALEVFQGLDAGLRTGDYLNIVIVGSGNRPQPLEWRLEARILDTIPGIGDRVAEGEGAFTATGLQQVEVLHRGLGRLHRGPGAVDLPVQLGDGYTDRVIHSAGAARENVDIGRCSEYRGGGGQRRGSGQQT